MNPKDGDRVRHKIVASCTGTVLCVSPMFNQAQVQWDGGRTEWVSWHSLEALATTGEIRSVQDGTGAEKGVKPARHSLIPPEALDEIARHYGVGAQKYEPHNWRKGYDWSKSYDALQRHAGAFWSGEDLDPETKTPHMAAVAFHAMTLLVFMKEHPELDDRFKPGEPTND